MASVNSVDTSKDRDYLSWLNQDPDVKRRDGQNHKSL